MKQRGWADFRHQRILCALFFLSGFPALIYQLTWQRALFRIFGVNIESVSIIVAAFMLGLGFGSLMGGLISKRHHLPLLLLLAIIEILTGLFGIISLKIFELTGAVVLGLPLVTIAAVVLLLVLLPTLLMGATLPLLISYFVRMTKNVGGSVGVLYYVNTLGAGTACLLSVFILFPLLGMQGSIYIAVALNGVVASGALLTHLSEAKNVRAAANRTVSSSSFIEKIPLTLSSALGSLCIGALILRSNANNFPTYNFPLAISGMMIVGFLGCVGLSFRHSLQLIGPSLSRPSLAKPLSFAPILLITFVGGFVSLSYEIFFFRALSLASGNLSPVFATTLGVFLIGIASGALKAGLYCQKVSHRSIIEYMARSILIANVAGLLFLPLLSEAMAIKSAIFFLLAFAQLYFVAYSWSTLLPCFAHLGIHSDNKAGMQTALLYIANIIGSTTGVILTGFVLMEHLGLVNINIALIAFGCVCLLLLANVMPLTRRSRLSLNGLGVALASIAFITIPAISSNAIGNLQRIGGSAVARVVENRSGIIVVDEQGAVYGNGMYDGKFNTDLFHHDTNIILRPYALSLFHPNPRDVLMIGLASGSWAQVIANNPNVEKFTIVEINPGYLKLIAERPEVSSVLSNPKVSIITDDGRRWLNLFKERRFDAIISNTTHYFRSNSTNLLSKEFLELVKKHLKQGGIFFYNTTGSLRVQRTACLAFPYGALFTNHMVVSMQPIDWNFDRWRQTLKNYRINDAPIVNLSLPEDKKAFEDLFAKVPEVITPCDKILANTSGLHSVTDDNMGEEWDFND